ncbi:sigma-54 dependent transcriptional regulator [Fulvivirga maritima]|uniref:sigma-54 interaction domain-containing protein n=1 Tax=Fulvivirga maritima TaxID=2904247 RepID=UPI001F3B7D42|nr:sigma-54 dependent transcriptional regulator [Fulvivirga maritima]UII25226.1 sigma-54 dependent transcriptional regulator [Fulvivirga maritima]
MVESEIQSIKQRFGIIGNSSLLNHAIQVAMQVAPTDMSVLITGESGSGKESFSKIIHHLSPRKHNQFIAINCGSIPEGTIDSELFGHEKGSFTGAHEARKGYFEVTSGGTIFLDEIGEMPIGTQARLLRVLENGEFIKVGSSKVLKTDVRVVAATNVNLMKSVDEGKFREDLYYRLSTVPIYVPPLRDRGNDIELLFRKFATDFAEKYKVKPIALTEDAKETLLQYRFPGNIRQLKNLTEQISVLSSEDKLITKETLLKYLPGNNNQLPALYQDPEKSNQHISERDLLYKVLFDMKKDMNDLKKFVLEALQTEGSAHQVIEDHSELFENLDNNSLHHQKSVIPDEPVLLNINSDHSQYDDDASEIQDITHETEEDDSLSIEKKEKELIIKALMKNNNKRKYAAKDLGISERTLYRKIKQYELEDL